LSFFSLVENDLYAYHSAFRLTDSVNIITTQQTGTTSPRLLISIVGLYYVMLTDPNFNDAVYVGQAG